MFRLEAVLRAIPLQHVGRDRAAPDGVEIAGHVRLDGHAGPLRRGGQHRRGDRGQHDLPGAADIQDHARLDRAHRQRAAQVVVAAQHHRRPGRQPGRRGRRGGDAAQHRAAGERVAQQPAVNARQRQHLIRPIELALVEQQRAGGHRVIGRGHAAQHVVDEILDQQPLVRPLEDLRLVFGHPQQPQRGAEAPQRVAADRKGLLRADVVDPPLELRLGARAVPTDERVEPVAPLVDGQAVHPHAGHGDRLDLARVVNRGDGLFQRGRAAAPDLLRLPDGPFRVRRIGVKALGRAGSRWR